MVNADRGSDDRRVAIHAAAVEQFTKRGYAGTSMIHIAEAAGLSRPALYQYFKNKDDVFASAFVAVFEQHAERALTALGRDGDDRDRLDAFLQRFEGDLWEQLRASDHADEIMSAKSDVVVAAVGSVVEHLWAGAYDFVASRSPDNATATEWIDLLRFGPKGCLYDSPPIDVFRQRLSRLASAVAADMAARR